MSSQSSPVAPARFSLRRFLQRPTVAGWPAVIFAVGALLCGAAGLQAQSFVSEIVDADIERVGPTGMALDTIGGVTYLYVSDQNHGRIIKYNVTGGTVARVGVFGTNGNGDGQFNSPYGIAIDPTTHDLYVAERANFRIQRITNNGVFVMKWGQYGTANGEFNGPVGVAVDATGNVYITDHNNHRIQKFRVTNSGGVWSAQHLATWGGFGAAPGQLNQPYGLTLDASGVLWVADGFNHRVVKFDTNGNYLGFLGSQGTGNGQFLTPTWVTFDAAGNYYITDTNSNPADANAADIQNQRVQKFSASGAFVTKWGSYGEFGGQFRLPFIALVDSNNFAYVADYYNTRIQKFNLSLAPTTGPVTALGSQAVTLGGTATFTANVTAGATYSWTHNGAAVGTGSATLTIPNVQPADAGIYSVVVTSGGTSTTQAGVLGLTSNVKVVGTGAEVGTDIVHPVTGYTYDQVALQGPAATVKADPGQIVRISYVDLSDDIVQVEFTGAGSLTLALDGASGPTAPAKYNQPGVTYWKGHANITITGANETTHCSVFSVGKGNAVNQSLFPAGMTYDGMADIACVAIVSSNGRFGGLRTANTSYHYTKGYTGVFAPGVQFTDVVYVGDIDAFDAATPVFMLGSSVTDQINGGNLFQTNGRPVQVSGITQLRFVTGARSSALSPADYMPAQMNAGRLEQNGADVTQSIVVNPN